MRYLKLYLVSQVTFFAIDMLWLGLAARSFYQQYLGFLMARYAVIDFFVTECGPEVLKIIENKLLKEGKIKPIIAAKFALLEAAHGYELLESGQVTGNIDLLAPELL